MGGKVLVWYGLRQRYGMAWVNGIEGHGVTETELSTSWGTTREQKPPASGTTCYRTAVVDGVDDAVGQMPGEERLGVERVSGPEARRTREETEKESESENAERKTTG